jgi:hypothetical protein
LLVALVLFKLPAVNSFDFIFAGILRLDYNNLTGEIPQGIGFLYGLSKLLSPYRYNCCHEYNPLPKPLIFFLLSTADLSLNNNQLSGRIPNEFQDLEILEVSSTFLSMTCYDRAFGAVFLSSKLFLAMHRLFISGIMI